MGADCLHVVVACCVCSEDGEVYMLTKGDNNSVHDRGLYAQGENEQQLWLKRSDILGRARG